MELSYEDVKKLLQEKEMLFTLNDKFLDVVLTSRQYGVDSGVAHLSVIANIEKYGSSFLYVACNIYNQYYKNMKDSKLKQDFYWSIRNLEDGVSWCGHGGFPVIKSGKIQTSKIKIKPLNKYLNGSNFGYANLILGVWYKNLNFDSCHNTERIAIFSVHRMLDFVKNNAKTKE